MKRSKKVKEFYVRKTQNKEKFINSKIFCFVLSFFCNLGKDYDYSIFVAMSINENYWDTVCKSIIEIRLKT